jgi:cell division transport system permease protein
MLLAGQDSTILKNIPGIKEVHFFSKEMAKKKYMEENNSDWDKVLTSNPLPNSFQITLDVKDWDSVSTEKLKKDIHDRVSMSNDISFSSSAYKKTEKYFFFEYKFK